MIEPPFDYALSSEELGKLSSFLLTCSHIDELLGQSLRAMLRLSGDEGVVMVFPLSSEHRLQRMVQLNKIIPLNEAGKAALHELEIVMKFIRLVRTNVAHAIIIPDDDGAAFHLRSKERSLSKQQIFDTTELANYACHTALSLRLAIGENGNPWTPKPLLERPEIPEFLRKLIPTRKG